jgi:hypothetical protein
LVGFFAVGVHHRQRDLERILFPRLQVRLLRLIHEVDDELLEDFYRELMKVRIINLGDRRFAS